MSRWFIVAVIALAQATLGQGSGPIIALSWTGGASLVDSGNGGAMPLGPTGANGINATAFHPAGTFYFTASGALPGTSALWTVNPFTGVGTNTGIVIAGDVRGLAITPAGVCYAIIDSIPDLLYTVNLANGATTLVGATASNGVQALAASPSGALYGWDLGPTGSHLLAISHATGASAPIGSSTALIQSLAFTPAGVLFGAGATLFTIDVNTGVETVIGSLNTLADVRGFEFVNPVLPSVSFIPYSGVVSPGESLAVQYNAPAHANETFIPIVSCTLGAFYDPVLPQPLGIAWDGCTDFYFNTPGAGSILTLTGYWQSYIGWLDAGGNATGRFYPPLWLPSGQNLHAYVTWISLSPSSVITVHGVGTMTVN